MTSNMKPNFGGDPVTKATETAANLFTQGMERAVEIQKSALDFAAQQNQQAIDACKKLFHDAPGMFVFDLAGQALAKCVETQKAILDLMTEQGAVMAETAKTRGESVSKDVNAAATIFEHSLARGIAVQHLMCSVVAQENNAVGDTVRRQLAETPAAVAVETVQHGVDLLIEAQRELLDIASKQVKKAAAAK